MGGLSAILPKETINLEIKQEIKETEDLQDPMSNAVIEGVGAGGGAKMAVGCNKFSFVSPGHIF